jgi:CHAT domain
MSTNEFKVLVDDEGVRGEYGPPGRQPKPAGSGELHLDKLTLATVGLMNRWLSYWDVIENSKIKRMQSLLEPETLEILGTQLWQLILDNDVGDALRRKIPRNGKPALRLSIAFKDNADATLRELPWEFLFEPQKRAFLATKTELLLTRYVSTEGERVRVIEVGDKEEVRALLIAALPANNMFLPAKFELGKLRTALQDVANLTVPDPIDVWNPAMIRDVLTETPYHIIHVVGICKGAPGKPEIYLGGGRDGFHDPEQFVELLTVNDTRPQLVILHLCDFIDGDATENFERLAPALIKRQVPAVLALQYAYAVREEKPDYTGLGKQFYQSLVDGHQIGAAVQASRRRLQLERRDRRFGTPVLYLQEDGALRRPPPKPEVAKPAAKSGSSGGQKVKKALIDLVLSLKLDDEKKREALGWVADIDQQLALIDVKNLVKEKIRLAPLDPAMKGVFVEMSLALGRLEQERDDGQS